MSTSPRAPQGCLAPIEDAHLASATGGMQGAGLSMLTGLLQSFGGMAAGGGQAQPQQPSTADAGQQQAGAGLQNGMQLITSLLSRFGQGQGGQ